MALALPSNRRTSKSPVRPPLLGRDWSTEVRNAAAIQPPRIVLHGLEGVGKTSFAAAAAQPLLLLGRGDTGLETLIAAGQIPPVPHLPPFERWDYLLSALDWLNTTGGPYRTLVLDSLSTFERLCFEFVCRREFSNDWGRQGFSGYMQGYDIAAAEWRRLLILLDTLREQRRMCILLVASSRLITFKNAGGADFDRYTPALHPKTWELTQRWADVILFARYQAASESESSGVDRVAAGVQASTLDRKALSPAGCPGRVLSTRHQPGWEAKSRYSLPESLPWGASAKDAWDRFSRSLPPAVWPRTIHPTELPGMSDSE
jgi:hypothetical protein